VKGGRSWIKFSMNDELNYMNHHILDLIKKKNSCTMTCARLVAKCDM
jgi:hypothetical protein